MFWKYIILLLATLAASYSTAQYSFGSMCHQDSECQSSIPTSICKIYEHGPTPPDGYCGCPDGFFEDWQLLKCIKSAERLGDHCESDMQCHQLHNNHPVFCNQNENSCSCYPPMIASEDGQTCVPEPKRNVGSPCSMHDQCAGSDHGDGVCTTSGVCSCRVGFVASANLDNCLQISYGLGSNCEEAQQCQQHDPLTDCLNTEYAGYKTCKCGADAVNQADGMECHLKATKVGDACLNNDQCIANLKHAQCLQGVCTCMGPFTATEDNSQCGSS